MHGAQLVDRHRAPRAAPLLACHIMSQGCPELSPCYSGILAITPTRQGSSRARWGFFSFKVSNLHNVFGLHFVAMRHNMDSPLLKAQDVASLGAEIRGLFYGRIFSTSSPLSLILQEFFLSPG